MQYWLFKSEPSVWSWQQQLLRGEEGEPWDGVRNYQARNYMKEMVIGDRGFFYHSQKEKAIIGIVKVIKTYEGDPTDSSGRFGLVHLAAMRSLTYSVSLAQIKQVPELQDMALIRQSRLSVMPITEREWNIILAMSE